MRFGVICNHACENHSPKRCSAKEGRKEVITTFITIFYYFTKLAAANVVLVKNTSKRRDG